MFFRSEFAHKLLIYELIITFYFPLIYALIIRGEGRRGGACPPLLICPGIMLYFRRAFRGTGVGIDIEGKMKENLRFPGFDTDVPPEKEE